jgi:DNA-binding SARP family transcriptional activator
MSSSLAINVLGELQILRRGKQVDLPASKKTRALLGYLAVVGEAPQPRQRLCDLFWEGPDDPRAGLRWSLTKLRPLVDDPSARRLAADREHVALEPRDADIDLVRLRSVGSLANASLDVLKKTAALYRGEVLEGLDLPDCYRYHEWCIAEREAARRLCAGILATLVDRLAASPEEALAHARARVAIDPLSEAAHIGVMQLLGRLGRGREALGQYESCRRILETQLGRPPSRTLEIARAELGTGGGSSPPQNEPTAMAVATEAPHARQRAEPHTDEARVPLVGRSSETATIAAALREAVSRTLRCVLLVAGEPGIGKTRLLAETAAQAVGLGGAALGGRAFEAEMVRPYGAWIDVVRAVPRDAIPGALREDLAPLLPELGRARGEADRNRLFDAVGQLLVERATRAPLVVALDDLQWFDEASVALLNYLSRRLAGSGVVLACAARAAEIDSNPRLGAMLRALRRDDQLLRIDLAPLDADGVGELVRSIDPEADPARILSDGGGNPLFSIELARAAAHGAGAALPTLDGLLAERLAKLDEHAAELLPWAAALGRAFSLDALAAVTSMPVREVLAALEQLERHGVFRVNPEAPGGGAGYDFAHDLVRRAAYRAMSEPRRRWVHLHVARAFERMPDTDGALAGDIAHHAALGGDSELAARAYAAAGERCLRVFALADASRLASSGLQHTDRLAPETTVACRVALLSVQVLSNQWLKRANELEDQVRRVARFAEERGMHAEATRCYYLVSFIHHERGDFDGARDVSLQAAEAGRSADFATRQHQLANTGRCLALIERDVERADAFLREAQALGPGATVRTRLELSMAEGLLRAYKGLEAEAAPCLEEAAKLAACEGDPWAQAQALTRIARAALENGRPRETVDRCLTLEPLVAKLSEGSEAPFVAGLRALARLALGEEGALASADEALGQLRSVDSKAHVAYILNALARHAASLGRSRDAEAQAEAALRAAEAVGQKSETAVARALLAKLALQRDDRASAVAWIRPCAPDAHRTLALSARARAAVVDALAALESAAPPSL